MICPMMGKECPGADNCMPASLGHIIEQDGSKRAICPIVSFVDSIAAAAYTLQPVVGALVGMTNGKPKPTVDDLGTEEYIRQVIKPDQMDADSGHQT